MLRRTLFYISGRVPRQSAFAPNFIAISTRVAWASARNRASLLIAVSRVCSRQSKGEMPGSWQHPWPVLVAVLNPGVHTLRTQSY